MIEKWCHTAMVGRTIALPTEESGQSIGARSSSSVVLFRPTDMLYCYVKENEAKASIPPLAVYTLLAELIRPDDHKQ